MMEEQRNQIKRAAVYIRCAKGTPYLDLEARLKECVEKEKDLQLVKCYVDIGYSGYNIDRPALRELIAAIETGNVVAIVVKQLASLSRNHEDIRKLLELFNRTGITIYELQGEVLQCIPVELLDKKFSAS